MTGDYDYIVVIKGKLKARNKAQAHMIVLSQISIGARLLSTENEMAIEVIESGDLVRSGNGHVAEPVPPFPEDVDSG